MKKKNKIIKDLIQKIKKEKKENIKIKTKNNYQKKTHQNENYLELLYFFQLRIHLKNQILKLYLEH
jgi:hypothetical protein